MVWQVLGALAGGMMANSAAKKQAAAIDRANEQNNQYLNAAMPYIKDQLGSVSDMYGDMLAKGPYSGPYYADPNTMQTDANNALYKFGMGNLDMGTNLMNASSGFANNANDLYSRFTNLSDRPDMMSKATDYATNNMNPIVAAMMRDDKRTLEEQTLPTINRAASASNNANSSRAGVADALANRAYDDRLADVRSDVFNSLRDASLNQSNTEFNQMNTALSNAGTANNQLGNAFTTGSNLATTGVNSALGAGNNQNTWDQGRIDADRANYDYVNNYGYNLGKDYMGFLTGNNVSGDYKMNNVSPALNTMYGAMGGFGFGKDNAQSLQNGWNSFKGFFA